MTDTKMVIVPLVLNEKMAHSWEGLSDVFYVPDCVWPEGAKDSRHAVQIELKNYFSCAIQASPNQGKVTPEMVEELAEVVGRYHTNDGYELDFSIRMALKEVLGLEVEG